MKHCFCVCISVYVWICACGLGHNSKYALDLGYNKKRLKVAAIILILSDNIRIIFSSSNHVH